MADEVKKKVRLKLPSSSVTKSPERLDQEAKVNIKNFPDFLKQFKAEYQAAETSVGDWNKRQEKLYKERYCIRSVVSYPWAGASNMALPMQDMAISKLKPEYVGIVWNTKPICDFTAKGDDPNSQAVIDQAQKAERAAWHLDWLVRTQMKIFPQVTITADKIMQKGFVIVKTVYEKKTEPRAIVLDREEMLISLSKSLQNPEDMDVLDNPAKIGLLFDTMCNTYGMDRNDENDLARLSKIAKELYSGTKVIEFSIDVTTYDAPKLIVIDPEKIRIPVNTPTIMDLEQTRWIDEKYFLTPAEIWRRAQTGMFDKDVAREVLAKAHIDPDNLAESQMKRTAGSTAESSINDIREGLKNYGNNGNNIPCHQVSLWYDADNDGVMERCVFDYAEEYMEAALRFISYPYDMPCWPYVKVPYELMDDRHYSPRGTVEIQHQLAAALNVQENQKINRQTIATSPPMLFNQNRINPANITFQPAQPVAVDGDPDRVASFLNIPNFDMSYAQEQTYLKNWGDSIVSSPDIASPVNMASGSGQSKQKQQAYIQAISSDHISTRQLYLQIWQQAWALIFERVWSLHMQYGPDELTSYKDEQGNTEKISKKDLFGRYLFSLGGRFGVQNPLLEAQKAQAKFHELSNHPLINQEELLRNYLAKDDPRLAKRLMKPMEQVAQEKQAAQQMQLQQKITDANLGLKTKQVRQQQNASLKVTGGSAGQHNAPQSSMGR